MKRRLQDAVPEPGAAEERFAAPEGWDLVEISPSPRGKPLSPGEISAVVNRHRWDSRAPTLFVVNDRQRSTPTSLLLSAVEPPLASWPDVRFVVAAGSHSPPGDREMGAIFGSDLYPRIRKRIAVHDSRGEGLVWVGTTSRGVEVRVNPLLFETRVLAVVGSVEPHYFAGYTGGRKSLVPGLASFETIRRNHRLALDSRARVLALADNPVHLDLEEGCRLALEEARARGVVEATAVNAVAEGERIFFVERGEIPGAVERIAPRADELFVREVTKRYPVVVASAGKSLDRDFYQALKAFEHGRHALAPRGTLILAAPCDRGCGPEHFARLLARETKAEFPADAGEEGYELGFHKVVNLLGFLKEGNRLFLVARRRLPEVERLGVRLFSSVDEAVTVAASMAKEAGSPPGILAIREATAVVPRIKG